MKRLLLTFTLFLSYPFAAHAKDVYAFDCTRVEKDYTETYAFTIIPSNKGQKAKVYLDDRDLDRKDEGGTQEVKTIFFVGPNIEVTIEARFPPELIDGITYPAGRVLTQIVLNQNTGKLKKVETIQGGILGVHLGNGTKTTEESCVAQTSLKPA